MTDIQVPEWVANATGKTNRSDFTEAELATIDATEQAADSAEAAERATARLRTDHKIDAVIERLDWARLALLGAEIDARIALAESKVNLVEIERDAARSTSRYWRIAFAITAVVNGVLSGYLVYLAQ